MKRRSMLLLPLVVLVVGCSPPSISLPVVVDSTAPADLASRQSDSLVIEGGAPQELDIKDAQTHAEFIAAIESQLGQSLPSLGFDREQWLIDSYGWCATIEAYGKYEADRLQAEQIRALYPPDQASSQIAFVRMGNEIIERYLCSD